MTPWGNGLDESRFKSYLEGKSLALLLDGQASEGPRLICRFGLPGGHLGILRLKVKM